MFFSLGLIEFVNIRESLRYFRDDPSGQQYKRRRRSLGPTQSHVLARDGFHPKNSIPLDIDDRTDGQCVCLQARRWASLSIAGVKMASRGGKKIVVIQSRDEPSCLFPAGAYRAPAPLTPRQRSTTRIFAQRIKASALPRNFLKLDQNINRFFLGGLLLTAARRISTSHALVSFV